MGLVTLWDYRAPGTFPARRRASAPYATLGLGAAVRDLLCRRFRGSGQCTATLLAQLQPRTHCVFYGAALALCRLRRTAARGNVLLELFPASGLRLSRSSADGGLADKARHRCVRTD